MEGEAPSKKLRKPYTITRPRDRWTSEEHDRFLEALLLYNPSLCFSFVSFFEFIGSEVQISGSEMEFFLFKKSCYAEVRHQTLIMNFI